MNGFPEVNIMYLAYLEERKSNEFGNDKNVSK